MHLKYLPFLKNYNLLEVKDKLKNIYKNLRKYFLGALAITVFYRKLIVFTSKQDNIKVLFIRIDRIGDLVLSTPALKAIKKAFPHSNLTVLAGHSNYPVLLNNPYVDKVIVFDNRRKCLEKLKTIMHLRTDGYDLAIDPYADYELKTAIIIFLSGARKRIGYASYGREVFFNIQAPNIKDNKHFVDLTLDIMRPLGIVTKEKTPEIFLTDGEKKWAENWLKENGIEDKPIIGIHPSAYYESQRWLPERFIELIEQLCKTKSYELIIFGGPQDEVLTDRIVSAVNDGILIYIADDLRRFAALLSCCSVFICNNSGPLHIAVAVNTPTVSFMGPTDKNRWMPIGDIHKVLRMDDLPCIGCNLGYCKIKTHDCMRLISSQMVMDAAEGLLKTKRS
jgi:heptosyltransferase-2